MTGFDIPDPEVICEIPGWVEMASMILEEVLCSRVILGIIDIGVGFRFCSVDLDNPVTTTSFNSVAAYSISKFMAVTADRSIVASTVL